MGSCFKLKFEEIIYIFLIFAPNVHVREVFPAILFLPILKVFYFGIFNVFF